MKVNIFALIRSDLPIYYLAPTLKFLLSGSFLSLNLWWSYASRMKWWCFERSWMTSIGSPQPFKKLVKETPYRM